jgi:hypothetical protein
MSSLSGWESDDERERERERNMFDNLIPCEERRYSFGVSRKTPVLK